MNKIQRYRRESELSYTLGATLTYELVRCRRELVTRVYISSETDTGGGIGELLRECEVLGIPVEKNDKAFNILSPKGNCYVIGEFRKESSRLSPGNHIVLVNPSDAGNLGTILRTAAAFSVPEIGIIRPGVVVYDPRTVRASMGAVFHTHVEYFESFEEYRARFPENVRYAFMLKGSVGLPEAVRDPVPEGQKAPAPAGDEPPYTLIFGNEATGLPDDFAEFCTAVRINISSDVDSLNLPMAVGIGLYEFTKKNWNT